MNRTSSLNNTNCNNKKNKSYQIPHIRVHFNKQNILLLCNFTIIKIDALLQYTKANYVNPINLTGHILAWRVAIYYICGGFISSLYRVHCWCVCLHLRCKLYLRTSCWVYNNNNNNIYWVTDRFVYLSTHRTDECLSLSALELTVRLFDAGGEGRRKLIINLSI